MEEARYRRASSRLGGVSPRRARFGLGYLAPSPAGFAHRRRSGVGKLFGVRGAVSPGLDGCERAGAFLPGASRTHAGSVRVRTLALRVSRGFQPVSGGRPGAVEYTVVGLLDSPRRTLQFRRYILDTRPVLSTRCSAANPRTATPTVSP